MTLKRDRNHGDGGTINSEDGELRHDVFFKGDLDSSANGEFWRNETLTSG
jgi:hypothetical protein